jgi:hypothetical protein
MSITPKAADQGILNSRVRFGIENSSNCLIVYGTGERHPIGNSIKITTLEGTWDVDQVADLIRKGLFVEMALSTPVPKSFITALTDIDEELSNTKQRMQVLEGDLALTKKELEDARAELEKLKPAAPTAEVAGGQTKEGGVTTS